MALCFICKKVPGVAKVPTYSEKICDRCARAYQWANYKGFTAAVPPPANERCWVLVSQTGIPILLVDRNGAVLWCFSRENDVRTAMVAVANQLPKGCKVEERWALKMYEWALANKVNMASCRKLAEGGAKGVKAIVWAPTPTMPAPEEKRRR